MIIQLVFDAAIVAGIAWFWVRRAQPTLLALDAEPLAVRLGLIASVVAIVAISIHFLAVLTATGEVAANFGRLAGGLFWIVIVGVGYPRYDFLRHATGTKRPGR